MIETVRVERLRQRIKALERQIDNLDLAMLRYREWTPPWMQRRATKRRIEADVATLKIMLETLEPGGDAST